MVLRDDAGDVEAPPGGARRVAPGPGRPAVPRGIPGAAATAGPLIDLYALYGLVFLDPVPVIGFWVAFNVFQVLLGIYAFRLDDEPLGSLWAVPFQQFVYRQLMYLVVYQSVISAAAGSRLGWHKLTRVGVQRPVA